MLFPLGGLRTIDVAWYLSGKLAQLRVHDVFLRAIDLDIDAAILEVLKELAVHSLEAEHFGGVELG